MVSGGKHLVFFQIDNSRDIFSSSDDSNKSESALDDLPELYSVIVTTGNNVFFTLNVHSQDNSDVLSELVSLNRLHHGVVALLSIVNSKLSVGET